MSDDATKEKEYDTLVVESIVNRRKGDVLNQYPILKTDTYPNIVQESLVPRISGATNYRKAPGKRTIHLLLIDPTNRKN